MDGSCGKILAWSESDGQTKILLILYRPLEPRLKNFNSNIKERGFGFKVS